MRFGCVECVFLSGNPSGNPIRLAPAQTDTPTDPPTEKNALFQGKVRFFSVGDPSKNPSGNPSGNPLGDPFGSGPNGHPNGSPNRKKRTFPRKSAFFFRWGSVKKSVWESVGESVGGSVWLRPKRTPERIPQRKKNALFLGEVRFFFPLGIRQKIRRGIRRGIRWGIRWAPAQTDTPKRTSKALPNAF